MGKRGDGGGKSAPSPQLPLLLVHLSNLLPSSICPTPTTCLIAPSHYQAHFHLWALAPAVPIVWIPPPFRSSMPTASFCTVLTPCKLKTGPISSLTLGPRPSPPTHR